MLDKLASAKAAVNNKTIIQEILQTPYINKLMIIKERESWMSSIVNYLKRAILPSDKEARMVEH